MSQNQKLWRPSVQTLLSVGTSKSARTIPRLWNYDSPNTNLEMGSIGIGTKGTSVLHPVKEETKQVEDISQESNEASQIVKSQVERFIEISKYFSSPLRRTASYICEKHLVSYPNPFRIEYRRGNVTTQHIKFSNLILEPVYIKLYKLIPDLEQLKYINLNLSRCKRIPPGLSFNLGFVYDDVEEKSTCTSKMVVVAHRKSKTPCYQICEIDLVIEAQKNDKVTV